MTIDTPIQALTSAHCGTQSQVSGGCRRGMAAESSVYQRNPHSSGSTFGLAAKDSYPRNAFLSREISREYTESDATTKVAT